MSTPEPYTNVRSASTTSLASTAKIKRPRRAKVQRRRQAPPHRLAARFGIRTPVTLTVTIRQGAELWAEVKVDGGRFFVSHDASVFDLVQLIIRGGYTIEEHTSSTALEHRRGVSAL
jgi:hypothetical protein